MYTFFWNCKDVEEIKFKNLKAVKKMENKELFLFLYVLI